MKSLMHKSKREKKMHTIVTYSSGGKIIEAFGSFKEARKEWERYNPHTSGMKRGLFRNGELWITNERGMVKKA